MLQEDIEVADVMAKIGEVVGGGYVEGRAHF